MMQTLLTSRLTHESGSNESLLLSVGPMMYLTLVFPHLRDFSLGCRSKEGGSRTPLFHAPPTSSSRSDPGRASLLAKEAMTSAACDEVDRLLSLPLDCLVFSALSPWLTFRQWFTGPSSGTDRPFQSGLFHDNSGRPFFSASVLGGSPPFLKVSADSGISFLLLRVASLRYPLATGHGFIGS